MKELSLRERVSSAMAIPAILIVAWVHWGEVPQENVTAWLIYMCVVQILRMGLSTWHLRTPADTANLSHSRSVRILGSLLSGTGWGAIWFVLDSGQLDFLLVFKFGALGGALGVTVNSLSIVLPVYFGFVTPVVAITTAFLFYGADFLQAGQQISIFISVLVYTCVLVVMARSTERLTRMAFELSFERETALADSQEGHQREVFLRERLQDESSQLEEANAKLHQANDRLLVLTREDVLTGIFNRRYLVEELEHKVQLLRRYHTGFSLISFDIDHFKAINDNFGHQVGDLVLKALTQRVVNDLREIDVFGRWGGEEFLCILPNTPFDEAISCAERLRQHIDNAILVSTHHDLVVTASFGVASCQPKEGVDELLGRVDAALYNAKTAGRNQVKGSIPAP